MKHIAFTLLTLCFSLTLYAQKINPDFMDGMVYFQLKTAYPLQVLSWDANDRLVGEDFPFFTEVFRKYEVNDVLRPFHLFGNEGLLRIVELHFDRAQAVDSLVAELQRSEWVAFAEKVPLMRTAYQPDDPYYGTVKNLNWKWYLDMIKADSAWDIQTGSSRVKVAVVDNYVWGEHPDLQIDSINMCTVGYDRTQGYTYAVGTAAPPSSEIPQESSENAYSASHGTHCAGLVGAINNNRTGIASIGGGVTLMGVSTTTSQYAKYILYGVQGVQWAAMSGAKVISMSFGSATASQTQQLLMQTCHDAGIVLLASAGNEGDEDNSILYPAGYSSVISVASVDGDGKLSYFSQWGPGRADIAAPGGYIKSTNGRVSYPNILSTTYCKSYLMKNYGFSGTCYDGMQGTSMACPVAAGLVGLMLSKDSTLTPEAIRLRLQRTATPLNTASAHTIDGYGYINAYKALLDAYLMISANAFTFPKEAGSRDSITVTSSGHWSLSGLPSWLSASPLSGDSGKTTVVFTVLTENDGTSARTAKVLFNGEGKAGSKTLTAVQKNYSFILRIDRKQVRFADVKGLYDTLHVYATIPWNMNNEATWLASDIQQVGSDSSIVVLGTRSNNNWGKNRETFLVFSSDFLPDDTVYVMQRMPDYISLSAAQVNIGAVKGDTASLGIRSNVHWQLTGGDASWIEPDKTAAADTDHIVFTVLSDNATGGFRTADYTVTDGKITKTFTVKQAYNLSVVETEADGWTVFPNPAEARVICRFPENAVSDVCVYDAQGRLLETHTVEGRELQLDFSGYASGLYLLKYGTTTKQLIKK